MNNQEIGKQIKDARKAKGETQWQMGAKIGASQQILSGWERGKRPVPPVYRKRLAKEYGIKFEEAIRPEREVSVPVRRQLSPVEQRLIDQLRGARETLSELLFDGVRARRGRGLRRMLMQ